MPFRYLLDPLFLVATGLFLLNKFVLRPHLSNAFLHGHLNDCICIAIWVPVLLAVMRITRMRNHDLPPQAHEVLIPLVVWSWVFEVWLPQTSAFTDIAVADVWDVLCYVVGAFVAVLVWSWYYRDPIVDASAVANNAPNNAPNDVAAEQKPDRLRQNISG